MRKGVLSDQAVKERYPEYFPLNLGGQEFLNGINLDKHIFTGIKISKGIRHKNVSRFPINDLHNFAAFGAPSRKEKAEFDAVMNYRNVIGSSNVPPNLETAFGDRMTSAYTPTLPKRINDDTVTGSTMPVKREQNESGYISDRMKSTFSRLSEDNPDALNDAIAPGGFNPVAGKLSDDFVLSKLNHIYRDSPEELIAIERAYHSSGKESTFNVLN